MLQSGSHLPGTHPHFDLLLIIYSVYVCNNLLLKCSCFCRQFTIEHCFLEPGYVETLKLWPHRIVV